MGFFSFGLFIIIIFFFIFDKKAGAILKVRLLFVWWPQRKAAGRVLTLGPWFPSRRRFTGYPFLPHTHSLSLSVCSNLIDCVECLLLILSGERYYNQSWVGKVLPVWDTCIGQSTFWWHRGYFILFFFDFLLGNLFWNLSFSFVCWFLFQDSLIYTFLSH